MHATPWLCAGVAFLGVGLFLEPSSSLVIVALISHQTPSLISSPRAVA